MPKKKKALCIICGEETDQHLKFEHGTVPIHNTSSCRDVLTYESHNENVPALSFSYEDVENYCTKRVLSYIKEDRAFLIRSVDLAAQSVWESGAFEDVFINIRGSVVRDLENYYLLNIPLKELPKEDLKDFESPNAEKILKRRLKGESIEEIHYDLNLDVL